MFERFSYALVLGHDVGHRLSGRCNVHIRTNITDRTYGFLDGLDLRLILLEVQCLTELRPRLTHQRCLWVLEGIEDLLGDERAERM